MMNNEKTADNNSYLQESHGTGVLSTMIFMFAVIMVMIILKHYIG